MSPEAVGAAVPCGDGPCLSRGRAPRGPTVKHRGSFIAAPCGAALAAPPQARHWPSRAPPANRRRPRSDRRKPHMESHDWRRRLQAPPSEALHWLHVWRGALPLDGVARPPPTLALIRRRGRVAAAPAGSAAARDGLGSAGRRRRGLFSCHCGHHEVDLGARSGVCAAPGR